MRPVRALLVLLGLLMLTPTAAVAQPYGPDRPLRVLTYNIHHGAGLDGVVDLERIASVIEASHADVIGLQEVDRHWSDRSSWADQAGWLATRLRMNLAYGANLDLDPLQPDRPLRQYGTAILSKFPISDAHNTLLPKYPTGEQRGLLVATIKARGVPVRFANTHLTSNKNDERLEQSRRVVELIGSLPGPTVLVGDLNATPERPEITMLTGVWKDAWAEVGLGPGYTIGADAPTMRIDFVMHSTGITARSADVLATVASDHLPVVAQLAVPAPA